MQKNRRNIFSLIIVIFIFGLAVDSWSQQEWLEPFGPSKIVSEHENARLNLSDALFYVSMHNPSLKTFTYLIEAAEGNLMQASLRANPELSAEFEEFGWNAPGFKESEFVFQISQEIDLFGQRGARQKVARSEIDAIRGKIQQEAFDLYLEVKAKYYELAHAQEHVILTNNSLILARDIFNNIQFRLERGAALQSELLLAELEKQKAELELSQSKINVEAHETNLVSLWDGKQTGIVLISDKEPDFKLIKAKIEKLENSVDVIPEVLLLKNEADILRSEKELAVKEGKPTVTLNGGFKRTEVDNSKSFLFGVSIPLPLFNRNQGEKRKISAEISAIESDIKSATLKAKAELKSNIVKLNQLIDRHNILDSLLLPTSEKAYSALKEAYEAGRVPYTHLLEAERALNDISFEHNDMLFAIQEQIMIIEKATGVVLRFEKEN